MDAYSGAVLGRVLGVGTGGGGGGGEGTPYPKLRVSSFIIYFPQNLTEPISTMLHFPEE